MDPATAPFLHAPWLGALLWVVLHTGDLMSTVLAARIYRQGASEVLQYAHLELNPLYRSQVRAAAWVSGRFWLTLLGLAAAVYLLLAAAGPRPNQTTATLVGMLLGLLVFTRLALIGRALHNAWLFRRVRDRPGEITGTVRFGLATVLSDSALRLAGLAVVLSLAYGLSRHPWLLGGALGLWGTAASHLLWGRRRR